jgi:hypothetical protein
MALRDNLDGTWELLQPLVHESEHGSFTVPAGFVTDLASVPRLLWCIVPPFGRHGPASVIHDALYRLRPKIEYSMPSGDGRPAFRCITELARAQADRIFRIAMIDDGVPKWRAWAMYLAVRLFGRSAWNRPVAVH